MALFPDSIPADTDPVKLGASAIRALKTALNVVLSTYLNDDGTFKNNVVTGAALVDASVTPAKLTSGVITQLQVPTGAVQMFAGSAAPTNYVLCDGANYDGTDPTYAPLFALIGTTYGNSGGTSHFNVPDLKGRVVVGLDGGASRTPSISALGATDGVASVTLSPNQQGSLDFHIAEDDGDAQSGSRQSIEQLIVNGTSFGDGSGHSVTNIKLKSDATSHTNLQPSFGLNYIIKL
jgi:microcystin-dependent protein